MSQKGNVLALDVGTQSVGAFVFDQDGRMLDGNRAIYQPAYYSPQPGWAEQDPEYYWQRLGQACRELWSRGKANPRDLAGLALTSQRCTVVNLDQEGQVLRPAMVWLDRRRATDLPRLPLFWRLLLKLSGLSRTVAYIQAEAEANWLRQYQPELWEKTAHFLYLSGYINYRLTGQYADSVGCQVGYVPFDYRRQQWCPPGHIQQKSVPIPRQILPELVPPGQRLGQLSAAAADHTGLPQGLPVISGASDKACEVLGSGCLEPHQACIGYATTATINVNSQRYIEPLRLIPPYPSAQAGAYNLEVQIYRGFWMVTWFKEQFAQLERRAARERGVATEVLLEELARQVPPGSLGLTLQPYWTPGVRQPGLEAKGSIIGFGCVHCKEHMYRALLEGLAYSLREGRERIEKKTGIPISQLYICGGGSKSDLMMQISADVFNLPAIRPSYYEASALGVAILAAVGLGLHQDLAQAVSHMTSQRQVFQPQAENVQVYDGLYREVYRAMYSRLRPLYKTIMHRTGYPQLPGQP